MTFARVLSVPLCAAFAAALVAHVGIDVAGDYLLPHDAYDDVAHGSRTLVLGLVATFATALALAWLRSAVREARGSVEAFGRTLHASVALGRGPFLLTTLAFATIVLVAMEALDVRLAGGAIDDPADLFGGSLALGLGTLGLAAFASAFVARRLVRAFANVRRTLVRALASAFAVRGTGRSGHRTQRFSRKRSFGSLLLRTCMRDGRGPPTLHARDTIIFS